MRFMMTRCEKFKDVVRMGMVFRRFHNNKGDLGTYGNTMVARAIRSGVVGSPVLQYRIKNVDKVKRQRVPRARFESF